MPSNAPGLRRGDERHALERRRSGAVRIITLTSLDVKPTSFALTA